MTTFFTSDEHHGHRNIIEYCKRPFADVLEQTKDLIARHNALIKPEDTVYHLGDFSLNANRVPEILPLLNGKHRLIAGNHDQCHSLHGKKREKALPKYAGFLSVAEAGDFGPFTLCHLPYVGDNTKEVRFLSRRPKDSGGWLLHGHVHCEWQIRERMINVGVDVWNYAPVQYERLLALCGV